MTDYWKVIVHERKIGVTSAGRLADDILQDVETVEEFNCVLALPVSQLKHKTAAVGMRHEDLSPRSLNIRRLEINFALLI